MNVVTPRWLPALAAVFAVLAVVLAGVGQRDRAGIGEAFPDFALESVLDSERTVTLATLGARPALVNVWGSWCLACRDEHDFLLALAGSGEVALYGVNYLDKRADAIRWLEYFGDPYRLSVYDDEGSLGGALGVDVVPRTYLVDGDGRILYSHIGPMSEAVMAGEIRPRIREAEAMRK